MRFLEGLFETRHLKEDIQLCAETLNNPMDIILLEERIYLKLTLNELDSNC